MTARPSSRRLATARIATVLLAAFSAPACGGRVAAEPGAAAAGAAGSGGADDAGAGTFEAGADVDADQAADVWTNCSTPEGFSICGGPNGCNGPADDCTQHGLCEPPFDGGVSVCALSFGGNNDWVYTCDVCEDGEICVPHVTPTSLECAPYNAGVLFDQAGAGGLVRYADKGLWTGEALPLPETCPQISGVTTCGGHCGGCAPGEKCVGRSPRHPLGMCAAWKLDSTTWNLCSTGKTNGPCPAGLGCFTFTVEPDAQDLADLFSFCIPNAACQAAAVNLPGGGKCQTY